MTNKREELIEEAAKVIYENERQSVEGAEQWPEWDNCWPLSRKSVLEAAEAVLAVFEQSHTPTNDEREALMALLLDELGWKWDEVQEEHIPSSREILGSMADRIIRHFRRPVQGEPSGYRAILIQRARAEADHWRALDDTDELVGTLVEMANMLASLPEPKGEPTDAQELKTLRAAMSRVRSVLKWEKFDVAESALCIDNVIQVEDVQKAIDGPTPQEKREAEIAKHDDSEWSNEVEDLVCVYCRKILSLGGVCPTVTALRAAFATEQGGK